MFEVVLEIKKETLMLMKGPQIVCNINIKKHDSSSLEKDYRSMFPTNSRWGSNVTK